MNNEDRQYLWEQAPQQQQANHRLACYAVLGLRSIFTPVARFLDDREGAIRRAECAYQEKRQNEPSPESKKEMGGVIERYQAKIGLLLNTKICVEVRDDVVVLGKKLSQGLPEDNFDYDAMAVVISKMNDRIQACARYVDNCLNVLSGKEKKLAHLEGPTIP